MKKRFRIVIITICLMFLYLFFNTSASAATPYGSNGKLSIQNGKVVNEKGCAYTLKGVSTHGIAWYPQYVNKKAFQTLRNSFGVNTIRLAVYTSEYGGYCTGGDKKQIKQFIDQGVAYATSLGMYVIIDWHILSDGNPLTYKSQANTFFKEISQKYADQGIWLEKFGFDNFRKMAEETIYGGETAKILVDRRFVSCYTKNKTAVK